MGTQNIMHGSADLLDQHVARIVDHHFHPETGAPYWIRRANEFGLEPRRDLRCYADLRKLGSFDSETLRTIPIQEFTPRSRLSVGSARVFETGGTSGPPKRVIDAGHQEENARWVADVLRDHGFGDRGAWLNMFPSGPHAVSLFTYALARSRGELCYFIDIDPRWVKLLVSRGQQEVLDQYLKHILGQSVAILRSQRPRYLFTTPKLLEYLIGEIDLAEAGIRGIVCGGTQLSREFYRYVKSEVLPQVDFCALYGNTLMGVAPQAPPSALEQSTSTWSVTYYGHFPKFIIETVDEGDGASLRPYGQRGRVRIAVLNEDVFIPSLLERDTAVRVPPCARFPWDGVADIQTYALEAEAVVEGVY